MITDSGHALLRIGLPIEVICSRRSEPEPSAGSAIGTDHRRTGQDAVSFDALTGLDRQDAADGMFFGVRLLTDLFTLSMDSGRQVCEDLLLALADAERIFATLIAVAPVEESSRPNAFRPIRAARCLVAIAEILRRMGERPNELSPTYPYALRERLPVFAQRLEAAFGKSLS
jgi:hypothetical protein